MTAGDLVPAPAVRTLLGRYPFDERPRYHIALECSRQGSYAGALAAIALCRSLLLERAAVRFDAALTGAKIAMKLGLRDLGNEMLDAVGSCAEYHQRAAAEIKSAVGAPAEVRDPIPTVSQLVNAIESCSPWSGTTVAGGPTAALAAIRAVEPMRYGIDIEFAVPLAGELDRFVCAEVQVPQEGLMMQLRPLFQRRVRRVIVCFLNGVIPNDPSGYTSMTRTIEVEGDILSLGDARAWALPLGQRAAVDPKRHVVTIIEWTLA